MVNINKRLYRGVWFLFVVFLLAPMEDGCKLEKATASDAQKVVVPLVRFETPFAKGNQWFPRLS